VMPERAGMTPIVGTGLLAFAACAAQAQTAAAPLSFEAASVKAGAPRADGMIVRGFSGGPDSSDPGTLIYSNVTLKLMVIRAYDLKDYQVEGPDWIDTNGFDVMAKMAPGTTTGQMRQMLQLLLAQRFHLVVHRETRQLPIYALTVAKGGPKMKEAPAPADGSPAGPGALRGGPQPGPDGGSPPLGRAGGPPPRTGGPGVRIVMTPNGRQLAGYMTMTQFANALGNVLDRAVVDQTELSAAYDVNVTWMPDELDRNVGPMAPMAMGPPGGEAPRGAAEPDLSLPQALQEKLGLRLDPRKSPAEVLVIDHADKAPVEN